MSRQVTPRYSREQTIVRFWAKVHRGDPLSCWNWKRSVDGHGYGQVAWNGKRAAAHRVSFEIANGPVPDGKCVLHRCDNPRCVNPAHLFLGTMKDNTRDMLSKGRNGCGRLPGEQNPIAKLTEESVREIRRLRLSGVRLKIIAARFRITEANVSLIAKGKGWKHVV